MWLVKTVYLAGSGERQVSEFRFLSATSAELAARGMRIGGRTAIVAEEINLDELPCAECGQAPCVENLGG